ncbi:MAG: TadE/TadG family type IV pilus assembly protein [Planctomycetales bacterium]
MLRGRLIPGIGAKSATRRRGAAIVETAVVLPIFFLVVMGIIEFGRAFMVAQLVTNAARGGVRMAITGDATNATVTQEIQDFLKASGKINASDVKVSVTITPYPGNPVPAGNDVANCTSRDLINVKVEVPFNKVSFLPPTYLKSTVLNAQAAMRFE